MHSQYSSVQRTEPDAILMTIDTGATREPLSGVTCSTTTLFFHSVKVVNTSSRLWRFLTPLKVRGQH